MASTSGAKLRSGNISSVLTNNTSSVEKLRASTNGFMAELVISNYVDGNVTLAKVQHSSDGTNWYDLVTFTVPFNSADTELKNITTNVLEKTRTIVTTTIKTVVVDLDLEVKLHYRMIRS